MDRYEELKKQWKQGWQLDTEYDLPRLVFSTQASTRVCYIYDLKDFDAHLEQQHLTNLEYMEGKLFYSDNKLALLKAAFNNRVPAATRDNYKKERYHATRNQSH